MAPPGDVQANAFSHIEGSKQVDPSSPLKWTCRLAITFQDGTPVSGTGFLVNLPPTYQNALIMTAGHNLVDSGGLYATKIEVIFGKDHPVIVERPAYTVSKSYQANPKRENGVNDYGFIMIPKVIGKDRGGFGYSLLMRKEYLMQKDTTVYGYPGGIPDIKSATGRITDVIKGQLVHGVSTDPGQSGGPICVMHDGTQTVVGIHNYGESSPGDLNRGTILTCENLFELLQDSYETISLELKNSRPLPEHSGIFLKIPPGGSAEALAQRGEDRYTRLHLVPVETRETDTDGSRVRYIVLTGPLESPTYLKFNGNGKPSVTTTNKLGLVDGRPTEKNVVGLQKFGQGAKETYSLRTAGSDPSVLRITGDDPAPTTLECKCTISEIKGIDLVDPSVVAKGIRFFKTKV